MFCSFGCVICSKLRKSKSVGFIERNIWCRLVMISATICHSTTSHLVIPLKVPKHRNMFPWLHGRSSVKSLKNIWTNGYESQKTFEESRINCSRKIFIEQKKNKWPDHFIVKTAWRQHYNGVKFPLLQWSIMQKEPNSISSENVYEKRIVLNVK